MESTLKILACIKQVADVNTDFRLVDNSPFCGNNTVYVINRYDEYALEEALQLKDSGLTAHIRVISIGPERVHKALRRTLEMGADEAYHITSNESASHMPSEVARYIADFAHNNYDIILTGVMSEDAMNQQTGQILASMLGYNFASGVTRLSVMNNRVEITRELDAQNYMQYHLDLPCVITIQSSIHRPRYPSLSNVLRARKQEINVIQPPLMNQMLPYTSDFTMPQKITDCIFIPGDISHKARELYAILHRNALI